MTKIVAYSGVYSPEQCRKYAKALWVFGDNLKGVGMGGQACIRTQPNSVGVPTKRAPGGPNEFFHEGWVTDMHGVIEAMTDLVQTAKDRKCSHLVLPVFKDTGHTTLGCGLARLPEKAPSIYAFINAWSTQLIRQRNL